MQRRAAVHVVGAEYDVDVRRPSGGRASPVLLGQAAGDHDLALPPVGRAGVLPALQVAEVAVQLVVGVLPDAAGVEDDDVGVVERTGRHQPVLLEQAGDALGVVLVHLASEGADDVAAGSMGDPRIGPRPWLRLGRVRPWCVRLGRRTAARPEALPSGASRSRPLRSVAAGDEDSVELDRFLVGRSEDRFGLVRRVRPRPACWSTRSEISTMISGFSARKVLAFSRPWPSCSPS